MCPPPKLTWLLVLLLAVGTCYYYFGLLIPQSHRESRAHEMGIRYSYGGDFYPIWLTGRELLAHRVDPYTPEMTREIQIGLYGRTMDANRPMDFPVDYRQFSYPLYSDLLAAPLLPFSFEQVRIVLTFLLAPLTAASVLLWLRAFRIELPGSWIANAIVLTLISYPVLEGLYALQAGLLVAAVIAASIYALTRARFMLSGVLLAIATGKPQMVWLLAVFLLVWSVSDWKRRGRLAISFLLTLAVLMMTSLAILPGWLQGWWRALVHYSGYTIPPLPQLVLGRWLGSAVMFGILGLCGAACWKVRRQSADSPSFSLAVSLVLAVTVLLLPTGGAVYDQVVLLPAIFWLWSRRGEILAGRLSGRVLAWAAMVAIAWQWITACGVALMSFLLPAWAHRPAALVFPARMAAPTPFGLVALLSIFAIGLLRGKMVARASGLSR